MSAKSAHHAKKTYYNGKLYKSKLEAETAMALDRLGLAFSYESFAIIGASYRDGRQYTPDFYIHNLDVMLECTGPVDAEHVEMVRAFCNATSYVGLSDSEPDDGLFFIVGDGGKLYDPFNLDASVVVALTSGGDLSFGIMEDSDDTYPLLLESDSIIDLGCMVACRNSGFCLCMEDLMSAMRLLKSGKPYGKAEWIAYDNLMRSLENVKGIEFSLDDGMLLMGPVSERCVEFYRAEHTAPYSTILSDTLRIMDERITSVILFSVDSDAKMQKVCIYGDYADDEDKQDNLEKAVDVPNSHGPYVYGIDVSERYPNITITIEVITPEISEQMLGHNTHNRKMKRVAYSSDMANDKWSLNGSTIVFADDGTLLDGQNRLAACIKAGKPFVTIVVRGVPVSAQESMDIGVSRSLADALKLRGYHNNDGLASVTKALATVDRYDGEIEHGFYKASSDTFTRGYLLSYVAQNYESMQLAKIVNYARRVSNTTESTAMWGVLVREFMKSGEDDLEEFLRQVSEVSNPSEQVFELLKKLKRNRDSNKKEPQKVIAAWIVKAWNCWMQDIPVTSNTLRFRAGGAHPEEFPKVYVAESGDDDDDEDDGQLTSLLDMVSSDDLLELLEA